jgi:hypothetical protein
MDQFEKDEFWRSLSRLYDSTVELREASEKTREATEKTREAVEELRKTAIDLRAVAESHETRLDDLETVQRWLAAKEREREKG